MKLNRIAMAVLLAAPLPMVANAGVTVTPLMLGYHYLDEAEDGQRDALRTSPTGGYAMDSDMRAAAAIGYELTPYMGVEVEYGETQTDATSNAPVMSAGAKIRQLVGNVYLTTDAMTQNYENPLKPYLLVGAGQEKNTAGATSSKDTIGNLGLGAFYRMNDTLSLRGELRAIHNFDNNYWEGLAQVGLQMVLGGHLMPVVPVAPPVEVVDGDDDGDGVKNSMDKCPGTPAGTQVDADGCPVPVVTPPPAPVDSDGDGVTDDLDQCPNTPAGVTVDAKGCPNLVEDLKMELRVFFDINKSIIKDQYKPEIAKVADKLKEYPNATAQLEGHTDNTGPRKLNERLSLARANSVKSMLVNQYGVDAGRLSTVGYAWDRPIAPNTTKEGRAMNRRVYALISGSRKAAQ